MPESQTRPLLDLRWRRVQENHDPVTDELAGYDVQFECLCWVTCQLDANLAYWTPIYRYTSYCLHGHGRKGRSRG